MAVSQFLVEERQRALGGTDLLWEERATITKPGFCFGVLGKSKAVFHFSKIFYFFFFIHKCLIGR